MSLADLLELGLNLLDRLVFKVFDLLQRRLYHAQGLRVDFGSSQQLIDLRVFSLQALLYGLEFFLEDQVADAGFLVNFVDSLLELVKELLFFSLEVLVLLETHLVLPLDVLEDGVLLHDMVLALLERAHDLVVRQLFLGQRLQLLVGLLQGLHYLLVRLLLVHLFLLHRRVFLLCVT